MNEAQMFLQFLLRGRGHEGAGRVGSLAAQPDPGSER